MVRIPAQFAAYEKRHTPYGQSERVNIAKIEIG
jgi:hypothetical protein